MESKHQSVRRSGASDNPNVVGEPIEWKGVTELDLEGVQGFLESPTVSYSTTHDSISMFSECLNYTDTTSLDSWYPTMGITNPRTEPEDIVDRTTPSSLPWNEIHDWYEFCAEKGKEPYFRLGKQWLGFSVPQRVYLDEDRNPQRHHRPCLYPGQSCWKNTTRPAFARSADLDRHYTAVHRGSPAIHFPCDYSKCGRRNDPFTRKDHCRDHYKEFHKEDLGEFKGRKLARDIALWEAKQREWEVERKISPNWWRCTKCLVRVEIKSGWSCTSCGVDCELWRKDAREKRRENASPEFFPPLPCSTTLQVTSQGRPKTSERENYEEPPALESTPGFVQMDSNAESDLKTHFTQWRMIKPSDLPITTPEMQKSPGPIFPTNLFTTPRDKQKPEGSLRNHGLVLEKGASISEENQQYSPAGLAIHKMESMEEIEPSKDMEDFPTTREKVEPGMEFIAFGHASKVIESVESSPVRDCKADGHKTITKRKRKSSKPEPLRYDCPVTKRAINAETAQSSQSRGCTPMGLEFRHVWQHIRNAHHGCEVCGRSLKEKNSDRKHLREREKDPTACTANEQSGIPFEIGIDLFDRMEIIYEEKLPHKDKWIKWWQVTHPNEFLVPDPLHHGKITISMEDIPQLQDLFKNMWLEEPSLPPMDEKQTQTMLGLVEKLFQLYPTLHQHRHQRQKTKAPALDSIDGILQGVPQASALPASSRGIARVCDRAAMDFAPEVSDVNSSMEYFQMSSWGNGWNLDEMLKSE